MRWVLALAFLAGCSGNARSIDAGIDVSTDVCLSCRADQICVARYTGTCGASVSCTTKTMECAPNTCSSACEAEYCPRPYQCQNRPPCGGESPLAFTCYGP